MITGGGACRASADATLWSLGGLALSFGYAYVILAELGRLLLRPGRAPHAPPAVA